MYKTVSFIILFLLTTTAHSQSSSKPKEIHVPDQCTPVIGRYLVRTPSTTIASGNETLPLTVEAYADSLSTTYGGTILGIFDSELAAFSGFGIDNMSQVGADSML